MVRSDGRLLGTQFVRLMEGMHWRMDTMRKKTFANFVLGLNTSHRYRGTAVSMLYLVVVTLLLPYCIFCSASPQIT